MSRPLTTSWPNSSAWERYPTFFPAKLALMYAPRILPSTVYGGCQPRLSGYLELFQQLQPDSMNSCGTFCSFKNACTADWVGVPSDPTSAKTLSCNTSLRVSSAVFDGL